MTNILKPDNNDSVIDNRNVDPVLTKESLGFLSSLYTGNNKFSEINPIETLFGIFPPTLILVGSNEILQDDSRAMFSKISARQPLTKLSIYENEAHVWLTGNIYSKSSKEAIE